MASIVERNKKIQGGVIVVKGTRLPVSLILEMLADGYQISDINRIYPYLGIEKIKGVLAFSAKEIARIR
jgi:uncharacterized protein (DUF433 family)